jgi:hypothetical protein
MLQISSNLCAVFNELIATQQNATEKKKRDRKYSIPFKRSNYLSLATVSRRLCSWWAELSRKKPWKVIKISSFVKKIINLNIRKFLL